MSDSIFLVGEDGSLTEATGTAYAAEAELQELLAGSLDLLPGAQIDRDYPRRWLLVRREVGVPDHAGSGSWWSIDHLVVDQDAIPTWRCWRSRYASTAPITASPVPWSPG